MFSTLLLLQNPNCHQSWPPIKHKIIILTFVTISANILTVSRVVTVFSKCSFLVTSTLYLERWVATIFLDHPLANKFSWFSYYKKVGKNLFLLVYTISFDQCVVVQPPRLLQNIKMQLFVACIESQYTLHTPANDFRPGHVNYNAIFHQKHQNPTEVQSLCLHRTIPPRYTDMHYVIIIFSESHLYTLQIPDNPFPITASHLRSAQMSFSSTFYFGALVSDL